MKIIIQIPCFNEESTLPKVLSEIPKSIPGVVFIETQVILDGCTDNTEQVAREFGVDHIVRIKAPNRRWLGRAFRKGVDNALANDADILVNTDGDNQYPGRNIAKLVEPILQGKADIVIGDRNPGSFQEFSHLKRLLQRVGSKTVEMLTGQRTPDAVSGFRAYSRESLEQLHILTNYTYTVDTLMQALNKGLVVAWIPITPNVKTRESRLIKSLPSKVVKSGSTIVRLTFLYHPFRVLGSISLLFIGGGLILIIRFFFNYLFLEESRQLIQSLVLGGVSLVIGVQCLFLGIIGELLSANRLFIEQVLERIKGKSPKMQASNSSSRQLEKRVGNE